MPHTPHPKPSGRIAALEEAFHAAYPELAELSTTEIRLLLAGARVQGLKLVRSSRALRRELASLQPLPFEERT
jgi:hypothetical protein